MLTFVLFYKISYEFSVFCKFSVSVKIFYFIKNPPEGMTPKLVKNMTDSDLLEIHYFLIEDDDRDNDELKEGFYINLF